MHDDDDEFLRSIPPFLRRYHEPPPRKLPIRPRDLPAALRQAEPRLQPPMPTAAQTAAPIAPVTPKVVEIAQTAAPQPATPQTAAVEAPAAQRARIALAFENQDLAEDLAPGTAQDTAPGTAPGINSDDVAFQVTLPRAVVRQIRRLAVEQDSSQRAVVLRALGLAGLSLPEDGDIDRRGRAAKRQA
jgi:hypothetical protein